MNGSWSTSSRRSAISLVQRAKDGAFRQDDESVTAETSQRV